jgi:phage shock protein A
MNLLERVLTLLRANLDSVAERSDDPEKALRQLQLDMRNQLVQVKTEVAKAIAEGHVLQKRIQGRQAETDTWLKKAEVAVQQGSDTLARQALIHYNSINKIVGRYQQQKKEQEQLVGTLRHALQKLDEKIAEVETTIELLATRKRNALIQQRVYEALQKVGNKDLDTTRVKEALLNDEARAQALASLDQRDAAAELSQLSSEQTVEQQLNNIKIKQQSTEPSIENEIRRPKTGPLAPLSSDNWTSNKKRVRPQAQSKNVNPATEISTDKDLDLDYLKKLFETSRHLDA